MVDVLNESNEWRHLREILPDDIIIVDARGVVAYVSDSVANLAGYAPEELIGTSIERLVPDELRDAHVANRARYHQSPTPRLMSDHRHRLQQPGRTGT